MVLEVRGVREEGRRGLSSPSYGVPLTPFRTASQCSRSSSLTGPRCSSASFGFFAYSLSSRSSRCVVDEEGAVFDDAMVDQIWKLAGLMFFHFDTLAP